MRYQVDPKRYSQHLIELILVFFFLGVGSGSTEAHPMNWFNAAVSGSSPVARTGHRMVYDSSRLKVVLFGGIDAANNYLNDIWEWDTATRTWADVTPATGSMPIPRASFGMAYDAARSKIIIYGGIVSTQYSNVAITGDTWEWDGGSRTWTFKPASTIVYVGLFAAQLAYDPNLQQVILFGGQPYWGYPENGETYAWDGNDWIQKTTTNGPVGRIYHAMATDMSRSKVVLFGGNSRYPNVVTLQDTWEWNGSAWTQITPASGSPSARFGAAMAYDCARQVTVLFGGGSPLKQDSWEWDGVNWSPRSTQNKPSARWTAMAYDCSQSSMVLFGGNGSNVPGVFCACTSGVGSLADTYLFKQDLLTQPMNWFNAAVSGSSPAARTGHRMVYDSSRSKVVLFGGIDAANNYLNDIWEWDTATRTWADVTPATGSMPIPRASFGMAYDAARSKIIIYGGIVSTQYSNVAITGDTWEWDGGRRTWTFKPASTIVYVGLFAAQLAYDPNLQQVILFGGQPYWGYPENGETYAWDGNDWIQKTTTNGPVGRIYHAMATDMSRSKVVLFGGNSRYPNVVTLQDTWEWNGSAWTQITPASGSPSARFGAAMAYDCARQVTVLFGGGSPLKQDSWEWDGVNWSPRSTQNKPSARWTAMAYDCSQSSMVLFGGNGSNVPGVFCACNSGVGSVGDTYLLKLATLSQTITFNALQNATYGAVPFALSATASSGLPVSFTIVSGPATISGNIVTITGAGVVSVQASQEGDANYDPASTVTRSFSIAKATPTINVSGGTFVFDFNTHLATGSVTGVNGEDLGAPAIVYSDPILHILPRDAGTYSAMASFGGNSNYEPAANNSAVIVIERAPSVVTFQSSTNPSVSGDLISLLSTPFGAGTHIDSGVLQFFDGGVLIATFPAYGGLLQTSSLTAGSHSLTSVYSGSPNFYGSVSPVLLQIVAAPTPVGNDVTTNSSVGGTGISTTFSRVTSAGSTTVTPIAPSGVGIIPDEYQIAGANLSFDIDTTARFARDVTIAFNVPGINDPAVFNSLRVLHGELNQHGQLIAVDRTILPPDTPTHNFATRTIYARVTSLSPFIIVKFTPPTVSLISASTTPMQVNGTINTSATFTDPDSSDTHTATWEWGDTTTSQGWVIEPSGSVSNYVPGSVTGSHVYTTAGVYTITLTVSDNSGSGSSVFQYVVIYDPSAGFVTGGGWIDSSEGAYTPDPSLTGRATFGFVSKYQHGATVPTGNTQFNFHVASMNFNSTSYDWLVIAGARAQYKGTGTINGAGNYAFMLTAVDGQVNGGGGVDKFRIKIWDKATDRIIYDNQMGAGDDANPTTAIVGGSIVIHSN